MNLKNILLAGLIIPAFLNAATVSLDEDKIKINLKNNSTNIINFPFIVQKASFTTETPDDFSVSSKNKTVVIIPTAVLPKSESGDLLIWSLEGNPYLIKITASGENDQTFDLVSNKIKIKPNMKAYQFETGVIDSDIKKLMKKMVAGEVIPGYKKVEIKKKFESTDLELQKEYFYDGGKYRAETWYIRNKSGESLLLDYENFYTPGVLAIAFEKKVLKPNEISKGWLIINKHTIHEQIERNKIK